MSSHVDWTEVLGRKNLESPGYHETVTAALQAKQEKLDQERAELLEKSKPRSRSKKKG